jgi:S-DNA-T family DNA segregation ATPase FtsK/SpoIIIE
MSRRKKLIKLPFLKFKINRRTILNIIGFLLILTAVVLFLSFLKTFSIENNGKILSQINALMMAKFSGLAIFLPFIILLFAGLFFNSKKLKLIKANIIIGLILIFIALLGLFNRVSTVI